MFSLGITGRDVDWFVLTLVRLACVRGNRTIRSRMRTELRVSGRLWAAESKEMGIQSRSESRRAGRLMTMVMFGCISSLDDVC